MTTEIKTDGVSAPNADIKSVLKELTALRADMISAAATSQPRLDEIHPNYRDSAQNLVHYLAVRRHDLRPLQYRLAALGLSSLGRAESQALATVDAVLTILHRLIGSSWQPPSRETPAVDFAKGQRLLSEHSERLLGPATPERGVRIMVTMPSEAAQDHKLVHTLLEQGMDCMRINCAHDGPDAWSRMIRHLRRAEKALGKSCRVVMDLAGPKLRTGPIEPGPAIVRIRPRRDAYGRVTNPVRVWLTRDDSPQSPPSPADASIFVSATWLARLGKGDLLKFTDARNAKRSLRVVDVTDGGCWAESAKTAYIVPDTVLSRQGRPDGAGERDAPVSGLPFCENTISLKLGDVFVVTRDLKPGRSATYDSSGQVLTPAAIGCTIPEVFDDVQPGESIWFDDGKIGGIIEQVDQARVLVRITRARVRGETLRGDKGINLPDSGLRLTAMTDKDIDDLDFVVQHADVVELSFANTARDVELLQQHLERGGRRRPAVVLKIETKRGFENLPDMLLTVMRGPCCGVMIARGDLAVECGFERLAEIQEEILWICEAAHVPVIWATQVLETLAREGMPSRAEITDAAMADRAECVMLNKGPHVVTAVRVLDDILRRMQPHQAKKRSMLRKLHLASGMEAKTDATAGGK